LIAPYDMRVRLSGHWIWSNDGGGGSTGSRTAFIRSGSPGLSNTTSFHSEPHDPRPALTNITHFVQTGIVTVTGGFQFKCFVTNGLGIEASATDGSGDTQRLISNPQTYLQIEVIE